ncbi:hypothetical protein B0H17DRAFT_1127270 [Mycena rosella]|uniref:Uncharacterized protein n=1 Tax=Mycena rosella TaxID=1033263 RepID=A0AAD7GRH2_MYCRO|nr:hypothetical protein B0H17DRAFT_1127270 [Mycena rosella]
MPKYGMHRRQRNSEGAHRRTDDGWTQLRYKHVHSDGTSGILVPMVQRPDGLTKRRVRHTWKHVDTDCSGPGRIVLDACGARQEGREEWHSAFVVTGPNTEQTRRNRVRRNPGQETAAEIVEYWEHWTRASTRFEIDADSVSTAAALRQLGHTDTVSYLN